MEGLIERLSALYSITTPGIWRIDGEQRIVSSEISTRSRKVHICRPPMGAFSSAGLDQNRDNGNFIVHAHNSMPAILHRLDKADDMETLIRDIFEHGIDPDHFRLMDLILNGTATGEST